MKIQIFGGFLGSGKTTILMTVAKKYLEDGKKVAILVNEVGDIGVDGTTIQSEGYSTLELPNGCVCCSLTTELQMGIRNIMRDLNPDIMLVEPTGLAIPTKVLSVFLEELGEDTNAKIIGIVDSSRFPLFVGKRMKFVEMQLKDSSYILVNKKDIATEEEMEITVKWLNENVGCKLYFISAKTGEGMEEPLERIYNE